jgi:hypothetical protein
MNKKIHLAAVLFAALMGTRVQAQDSAWASKKSSWLQLQQGQKEEVFRFADT